LQKAVPGFKSNAAVGLPIAKVPAFQFLFAIFHQVISKDVMFQKFMPIAAILAALSAGPALAQANQPVKTVPSAPAVITTPKAATATPAPASTAERTPTPAQARKINLNTADANELDDLPQIGPARAKAIIEARAKGGRFRDWEDFVKRNVVSPNAEAAIREKVSF
jgi:DNA uptake protein ComE-like DNA-binding protein